MTGVKAVYLRKPWAGRVVGTRLRVLAPEDDLKRGFVDAKRAAQLLADGFAAETKEGEEVTVEELAAVESEPNDGEGEEE